MSVSIIDRHHVVQILEIKIPISHPRVTTLLVSDHAKRLFIFHANLNEKQMFFF